MKLKNSWYWLDVDFEWNLYQDEIQTILKKYSHLNEIKLNLDGKEFMFNFKDKYDLEIKTGHMVTIKNPFINEIEKIEMNIKKKKDTIMDKHVYHNMLKDRNLKEYLSDDEEDDEDGEYEWEH